MPLYCILFFCIFSQRILFLFYAEDCPVKTNETLSSKNRNNILFNLISIINSTRKKSKRSQDMSTLIILQC